MVMHPIITKLGRALTDAVKFIDHNAGRLSLIFSLAAFVFTCILAYQFKDTAGKRVTDMPESAQVNNVSIAEDFFGEIPGAPPALGDPGAKLTIYEFADFQCPFCGKFHKDILPNIKSEYIDTGKVRLVYLNFAFLGEESKEAAVAAKCALEQNKFWEYHDQLYNNQKGENRGAFSEANLKSFASKIALDTIAHNVCMTSGKYEQLIEDEKQFALKYGVRATPTFIVGEQVLRGARTLQGFKETIEQELTAQ